MLTNVSTNILVQIGEQTYPFKVARTYLLARWLHFFLIALFGSKDFTDF